MECSVCKGQFKEPKVFCCTRLCKTCLQKHIDVSGDKAEVTCLVCRAGVRVPDTARPKDTWASQFRTDGFLQRLQGAGDRMAQKHDCFVCAGSRQTSTAATVYCFDCDNYFCGACNGVHLQLRGFSSHSTALVTELQLRDLMTQRPTLCAVHTSKPIDGFCRECNALLCKDCVHENHLNCLVHPMSKIAKEKRKMLHGLKEEFEQAVKRAENENEILRGRATRVETRAQQQREKLESAFSQIEAALAESKARLLATIEEEERAENQAHHLKAVPLQTLVGALKGNKALADEILDCGSDLDIIESADILGCQCNILCEMCQNGSKCSADKLKRKSCVDDFSVNTVIKMINTLGSDVKNLMLAFKTTTVSVLTAEDKETPTIADILVVDSHSLLVADSANKCLKFVVPRAGEKGDQLHRLQLETRPKGITILKTHIAAVSGRHCLYIIAISDEKLTIKMTVSTQKDYSGIASISPINIAAICKQPPSIDIIDITGTQLRSIESEVDGVKLFHQPSSIASAASGGLLVTDRTSKTLTCLDQLGRVKFVHRQDGQENDAKEPRGACVDKRGCVFLLGSEDVWAISPQGKQLCKILSGLPESRAISVGANVMAISTEEQGILLFVLADLKDAYG